MREVIARRKDGLLTVYIIFVVLGIFCLVPPLFLLTGKGTPTFFTLAVAFPIVGILLIVISCVYIVQVRKVPEEIIVYENGELHFPGFTCAVADVKNVTYRRHSGRHYSYAWGSIAVAFADRAVSYNFVADVENVHNRLVQLMRESLV